MNRPFKKSALLLALLALLIPLRLGAAEKTPNVLLIISDDLTTGIGCYGHPAVKTPNLERLAEKCVRFDRAYCNYPVCHPSRTSFLSGRYPRTSEVATNGVDPRVVLGPDFQFLPEYFKASGYFTAGLGKVTHTPEHLHSIRWDVVGDTQYDPAYRFEEKKATLHEAPDEEHPDGITARAIARLMEEHRDRPFFLAAGFHRPHAPRIAPQKYYDLYPLEQIELSTTATEPGIPPIALPPYYKPDMPEEARRKYLQTYHACVSFTDAQVGVLLEAMDRLDLWHNTIVVFLGDNGYHLDEHGGFWGKMSLMDRSARVPLLIHAPGLAKNTVCRRPVSLIDLFPTLTALCGLPPTPGLEGTSLTPLLQDPGTPWNHPARLVVTRGDKREKKPGGQHELGRSVHTEQYSFLKWPDGSLQLYDDQADPKQTRNLAGDPAHAGVIAELEKSLLPEDRIPIHKGVPVTDPAALEKAAKKKLKNQAARKTAAASGRKPNVVVILADDLGFADVGVHGCEDIPTPHLDSIAREGVRCAQGYVSAPLCSPSRAGLMTGRYQQRFGHEFNPGEMKDWGLPLGETTLAQHMKAAGYATALVGKWHLGYDPPYRPTARGFDEHYGTPANTDSYFHPKLVDTRSSPEPKRVKSDDFYTTDAYGRRAAEFVREHRDGPFFLYLAFNAVHTPLEAPQKYLDRFPHIAGEQRRVYAAMLGAMDDAVGALLAELRASRLEQNTLVFFLSDNGAPGNNGGVNLPFRGAKGAMWEGGIHAPFFVKWPGRLPAGGVYEQPVSALDILPTALAAAGVPPRPKWRLDGVNLLPFLTGKQTGAPHETLFWRMGQQMAVRQGDWKLARSHGMTSVDRAASIGDADLANAQLFNLASDANEQTNMPNLGSDAFLSLSAAWQKWNGELASPLWPPMQEESLKRKREKQAKKAKQK